MTSVTTVISVSARSFTCLDDAVVEGLLRLGDTGADRLENLAERRRDRPQLAAYVGGQRPRPETDRQAGSQRSRRDRQDRRPRRRQADRPRPGTGRPGRGRLRRPRPRRRRARPAVSVSVVCHRVPLCRVPVTQIALPRATSANGWVPAGTFAPATVRTYVPAASPSTSMTSTVLTRSGRRLGRLAGKVVAPHRDVRRGSGWVKREIEVVDQRSPGVSYQQRTARSRPPVGRVTANDRDEPVRAAPRTVALARMRTVSPAGRGRRGADVDPAEAGDEPVLEPTPRRATGPARPRARSGP